MPSKNDLSALKAKSSGTLKVAADNTTQSVKPIVRKAGRKAKPANEKESFTVALKLTEAEGQALLEKAGLVPLATFVKAYLRNDTDLLN